MKNIAQFKKDNDKKRSRCSKKNALEERGSKKE